ncbi:TetR/AcrR family transcriptional regulator [Egibacter rhizosphaerae]|uniref:TetR/AcrR family transcriptional regulator n=1 Tax=Egibacter rhizosphaerae TaxID=1670831 RepID=A0A411YGA3_9ACTN|nr:TetR/AcrR family transcriptional regulator [Egibacter rhizosphaerae]QBI20216.1 TetR/AcrR family transcriptional regulator [Egibacter rhizosphaerae]
MATAPSREEDRTARARIRDAAIARFAAHGAASTSVKEIAGDVGISPALVFHHFGSKEGLRTACDEHVVAVLNEQKQAAMREGPQLDVFEALRQAADGPPVMRYLGRMLAEGSEQARPLVDGMVDVAMAALEEGARSGMLEPIDEPRDLSVVLVLWSLGLLVLHDHAERLLGVEIAGTPEDRARYVRVAIEALRGLFTEEAYHHSRAQLAGDSLEKEEADD